MHFPRAGFNGLAELHVHVHMVLCAFVLGWFVQVLLSCIIHIIPKYLLSVLYSYLQYDILVLSSSYCLMQLVADNDKPVCYVINLEWPYMNPVTFLCTLNVGR